MPSSRRLQSTYDRLRCQLFTFRSVSVRRYSCPFQICFPLALPRPHGQPKDRADQTRSRFCGCSLILVESDPLAASSVLPFYIPCLPRLLAMRRTSTAHRRPFKFCFLLPSRSLCRARNLANEADTAFLPGRDAFLLLKPRPLAESLAQPRAPPSSSPYVFDIH